MPFSVILMTSCNRNILALLPFVRGIHWSTVTGGFLSWSQITWICYVFFGVCLNNRLNKHCSRRWFVTSRCRYDAHSLVTDHLPPRLPPLCCPCLFLIWGGERCPQQQWPHQIKRRCTLYRVTVMKTCKRGITWYFKLNGSQLKQIFIRKCQIL